MANFYLWDEENQTVIEDNSEYWVDMCTFYSKKWNGFFVIDNRRFVDSSERYGTVSFRGSDRMANWTPAENGMASLPKAFQANLFLLGVK